MASLILLFLLPPRRCLFSRPNTPVQPRARGNFGHGGMRPPDQKKTTSQPQKHVSSKTKFGRGLLGMDQHPYSPDVFFSKKNVSSENVGPHCAFEAFFCNRESLKQGVRFA